jgi:hypothetical protein
MSERYRLPLPLFGIGLHEARQLARGATQAIEAPFHIAGLLGHEGAARIGMAMGDTFNRFLGTEDARLFENPYDALLQIVGSSIVGLPARTLAAIPGVTRATQALQAAPPIVRGAVGTLEAFTPVTLPLTAPRIAANIAGGTVVGAGFEALDALAGQPTDNVPPVADAAQVPPATEEIPPTAEVAAAEQAPPTDPQLPPVNVAQTPDGGLRIIPSAAAATLPTLNLRQTEDGGIEVVPPTPTDNRTTLQVIRDNALLGALLAGGAAGGVAAYRRAQRARAAAEAVQQTDTTAVGTMPSPDIFQPTIGERLGANLIDETAIGRGIFREAEREGLITPQERDRLDADLATTIPRAIRESRAHSLLMTGRAPDGYDLRQVAMPDGRIHTVMSQRELQDEMERLIRQNPQAYADVNAAQAILNELSNRRRAEEAGVIRRITPRDEPPRVGMIDKSHDDLMRELSDIRRRNPEVTRFIDEHAAWAESRRQYLVRAGYISPQMAAKWRKANRHYVPDFDPDDIDAGYFTLRQLEEGSGADRPQSYVDARLDYDVRMLAATELNRARRGVIRGIDAIQTAARKREGNSRLRQNIIGPIYKNKIENPDKRAQTIKWREKGQVYAVQVYSPQLYAALRNAPSLTGGILNTTRLWWQDLTTGVAAALTGSVHAPISALYSMSLMFTAPVSRLPTGRLDRLVRQVTGDRLTLGAWDVTTYGDIVATTASMFASMAARELSNVSRRALFAGTGLLRNIVSPQRLTALANRLDAIYENSLYAEMQRIGLLGGNRVTGQDFTGGQPPAVWNISPEYQAVRPRAPFRIPQTMREIRELVGDTALRVGGAKVVRAFQLMREALDIIASGPQAAVYRLNRKQYLTEAGLTTNRLMNTGAGPNILRERTLSALAGKIRRAAGDPALRPMNQPMRNFEAAFPYATITKQGIAQYGRAFREAPLRTTAALVTQAVIPTMISLYLAMEQDEADIAAGKEPTRVQDLVFNAPHRVAGTLPFYVPGLPAEQAIRLHFDHPLSPLIAATQSVFLTAFGADDPQFFAPHMRERRDALRRMIEERHNYTMLEAFQRGFGELAPPPLIATAVAAAGYDMRDFISLNPSLQPTDQRGVRGFGQGQTYTDDVPTWATAIMQSWGAVGQYVSQVAPMFFSRQDVQGAQRNLGPNAPSILDGMMDRIALRVGDRLSAAAPILSGPRSAPAFDSTAEFVRDAERAMRNLQQDSRDVTRPGVLGSGREQFVELTYDWMNTLPPADRIPMRAIVQQVNRSFADMQALRDQRNSLHSAMAALRSDPMLQRDPIRLRQGENYINLLIRDVNTQIVERIVEMENRISRDHGIRFRISEFVPNRGMQQFRRGAPAPGLGSPDVPPGP